MNDYKADLLADLKDAAYAELYLKAALRESRKAFLVALKDVADAQLGMSKLAKRVVRNRESLYRTLSEQGNPRMSTLESLVDVLGFELTLGRKQTPDHAKRPEGLKSSAKPQMPTPTVSGKRNGSTPR